MKQVINNFFYICIPYFLVFLLTVTTFSPKKKEYKTSIGRLLSKVVDNNFLLCKIDTLRYEMKHCPAANQLFERRVQ